MNQYPAIAKPLPSLKLGSAGRLALLAALFFAEKVLLDRFVDSQAAQSAQGLGAIVRNGQHWGFRYLVTFLAAVAIFAYVRTGDHLTQFNTTVERARIRIGWMCMHAAFMAMLVPLSYALYRQGSLPLPFTATAILWTLLGLAAAAAAFAAMAPWSVWLDGVRALGIIWAYSALAALFGIGAWQASEKLWEPTSAVTFDLVKRILSPILPTLSADATTRVLSTDRFAIQISEVCSGLEGMGLILAFTVVWLLYFRREYIFPRALLLIPAGLAAMFVLNVVRICLLMLIGYAGYPEVASYGFHSQAGWIAFNTAACGMVYLSRRSVWLYRVPVGSTATGAEATENPVAVYLMPLLTILAAGVLSHALSGTFEVMYPLRLLAGVGVLWFYRRKLSQMEWRWTWRGPGIGVLVFLIWIAAARFLLPPALMPSRLAAMPNHARDLWLICRVAASVVTVPLAEELAYRGFLMRRFTTADFDLVPFQRVPWRAVIASAIFFGLSHGALWLPGIVAGVAFGFIVKRQGNLGEAVSAHVVANALVAVSVLGFAQWQLW